MFSLSMYLLWIVKNNFSRCCRSTRKILFANDFIHHGPHSNDNSNSQTPGDGLAVIIDLLSLLEPAAQSQNLHQAKGNKHQTQCFV